jgi:hypothetical protein
MENEIWASAPVDGRSGFTNAADPRDLAAIVERWSVPTGMPLSVTRLWERAIAQFRSGTFAYENFTDAGRTGFEAVDAALRAHVSDLLNEGEVLTFGRLIARASKKGRLTPSQYEWLSVYALHFRNKLTHADGREPMVLSPQMSAEMLGGIARFLTDLLGPREARVR